MSIEHLLNLDSKQNIFLALSKEQLTQELKTYTKYALTNETGLQLLEAVVAQLEPQVLAFGDASELKHKVEHLFPYNDHMDILHIVRDGVAKTVTVYFVQTQNPAIVLTHVFDNNFMAVQSMNSWPTMTRQELFDLVVAESRAKILNPIHADIHSARCTVHLDLAGTGDVQKFYILLEAAINSQMGPEATATLIERFKETYNATAILLSGEKEIHKWGLYIMPDLSMHWQWEPLRESKETSTSL